MRRTLLQSAIIGAIIAGPALAQSSYPERDIDMIVAFNAGGGTDVAARTLVPFIEEQLGGVTINVVNRPGAGGEVGFTALANAPTDGYTIGFINTPNLISIPISREANYTLDSFQPIGNIVEDPGTFAVLPDSPFQTLDQLVEYARENPGVVTYGTTGIGSDDHLAGLAFQRLTGIQMTHVPFAGSAPVRTATLGGHIALGVINIGEAIQYAESGELVVLGQMGEERWEGAAEVPTFREQGYDLVSGSHRGIAAPAGVDMAIINTLAEAIERAMNDPEFREKAKQQALPLRYLPPEAYAETLQAVNDVALSIWQENPWVQ
jgi:tripartite-type tricarboxylate transporter receptor subunit TctC